MVQENLLVALSFMQRFLNFVVVFKHSKRTNLLTFLRALRPTSSTMHLCTCHDLLQMFSYVFLCCGSNKQMLFNFTPEVVEESIKKTLFPPFLNKYFFSFPLGMHGPWGLKNQRFVGLGSHHCLFMFCQIWAFAEQLGLHVRDLRDVVLLNVLLSTLWLLR